MIDASPSLEAAKGIDGETLVDFLVARGWKSSPSLVDGVVILTKDLADSEERAQLVLPLKPGFGDEHRRIADAIRTLAEIEGCPEARIADKIRQAAESGTGHSSVGRTAYKGADIADAVAGLEPVDDLSITAGREKPAFVDFVADAKIESAARNLRKSLGLSDESVFNIVELLENEMPKVIEDFRVEVLPKSDRSTAYTSNSPPRIFLSANIYDLASRGEPRSRFMLAHEIAHLWMPRSMDLESFRRVRNASAHSNEAEAARFAIAFLIPSGVADRIDDPKLLSRYCNVQYEIAERRIKYLSSWRKRGMDLFFGVQQWFSWTR